MPRTANGPANKAKIARRVIEVLDYFDDAHREATVMDIVRRYGRPQSSTSELLSSLVELGLLHKDAVARSYRLSARAALIGVAAQAGSVRDGRLIQLMDRLAVQTGQTAAVFGRVGANVQVLALRHGERAERAVSAALFGGMQTPLTDSAVGLLLLSADTRPRCEGMVRRLNADACAAQKFVQADMMTRIDACRVFGHCRGELRFGIAAALVAAALPGQREDGPLALGIACAQDDAIAMDALRDTLLGGIKQLSQDSVESIASPPAIDAPEATAAA